MKKNTPITPDHFPLELQVPAFGYELLRNVVLPDILGKETESILYWVGKSIARKYPLQTNDDIIHFFERASWGTLSLVEQKKKNELVFELTGDLIISRFKYKQDYSYQLEAGFLAEQFQQQLHFVTEAYEQQKPRARSIQFTVQWDPKDSIETE